MLLCTSALSANVLLGWVVVNVDNRMVIFIFSTGPGQKKFSLLLESCLDQNLTTKPPESKSKLCLPPQENSRQSRGC